MQALRPISKPSEAEIIEVVKAKYEEYQAKRNKEAVKAPFATFKTTYLSNL